MLCKIGPQEEYLTSLWGSLNKRLCQGDMCEHNFQLSLQQMILCGPSNVVRKLSRVGVSRV